MAEYNDYVPPDYSEHTPYVQSDRDPLSSSDEMFYTTRLTPTEHPHGFHIGVDDRFAPNADYNLQAQSPYYVPGEEPLDPFHNPNVAGDAWLPLHEQEPAYQPVATGAFTPYYIPNSPEDSYYPGGVRTGDAHIPGYVAPQMGSDHALSAIGEEAFTAGAATAGAILGAKLFGMPGTILGAVIGAVMGPTVFHKAAGKF